MDVGRLSRLGLGVDQIGIVVPDLDRAVPDYGESFGISTWQSWTYDRETMSASTFRGDPGRFAMKLALGGVGPQIELIESLSGPSLYTEHIDRHGFGIHHVGCRVADLARVLEEIDYPVLQSGAGHGRDGTGGFAYLDTEDEFQIIVELIEAPRERRDPEREWSLV